MPGRPGTGAGHPRLVTGEDGGHDLTGVPQLFELLQRRGQRLVHGGGLGQAHAQARQGGLALDGVVLGGHVPERAHGDAASGVGVPDRIVGGPDPQLASVAVGGGDDVGALEDPVHQSFDDTGVLPVGSRVVGGVRFPRERRGVGQPLGAVAESVGERVVDLDDGAVLVADEEPLLQ